MPISKTYLPRTPPQQHIAFREQVTDVFESVKGVVQAASSPLPTQTGAGSYIQTTKNTGLLTDVTMLHPSDIRTIIDLLRTELTGAPTDDSTFLLERLVKLSSELPMSSRDGALLNNAFIQQLYDDLQHPPVATVGSAHQYRAADGSFNVRLPRPLACYPCSIAIRWAPSQVNGTEVAIVASEIILLSNFIIVLTYTESNGPKSRSCRYPLCPKCTSTNTAASRSS